MYDSMGVTPLTWQEIDAFCRRSTYSLSGWECTVLKRMSECYTSYLNNKSPTAINPALHLLMSDEEAVQARRDAIAAKMQGWRKQLLNKEAP